MKIDREREDISRFLVHLTRDYKKSSSRSNLLKILQDKTIYARNAHCLVMHKLKSMGFSPVLQRNFNTVCFTETPLTQIKQLVSKIEGRKIQLKPYGLIFWKEDLFEKGSSPAIYINAKGTSIDKFLLDEFNSIFRDVKTLRKFRNVEAEHYKNIVHYYSLINVVKDEHDFMWEREWRHHGDFKFNYRDIVAIIAKDPEKFEKECQKSLSPRRYGWIKRLPIITPDWTYEELIEEFAITIWDKITK
jgi:hypothetical protein